MSMTVWLKYPTLKWCQLETVIDEKVDDGVS